MEQINFNLLFHWFVGLEQDDEVWDATVCCHNRDRLLTHEIGVVRQKSAPKAEKRGFPRNIGMLPSRKLKIR
jgi:hypothetical protein